MSNHQTGKSARPSALGRSCQHTRKDYLQRYLACILLHKESNSFPGMGRMTLREMCGQYGLKQQRIVELLATKGIKADPEKSFKEIASAHGTDPHELFALIHEAATRE